ncbi:MAG: hypothetical protein HDR02_00090 [Lachnospiraceae bacterium]|nr:hypothetical protein [Lachnospiraceae bacterium]
MKREWVQKLLIVILFGAYFMMGILVYKDYGISTDEPDERETTFTNLKYAMDTLGIDGLEGANGDLENYDYRYYGIAMQIPPALVEWAKDFPGGATIYYMRHLWTFIVCFLGYICFYLMCREILKSRWLSLAGTAMIALYPRFFAEQFYNIKDMVFVSMVMVSMYMTVRVIESKCSAFWTLLFAVAAALTTNVRIVGIIFPVLLLGYLWLVEILNRCKQNTGEESRHVVRTSILIVLGYWLAYVGSMPILWKNPVKETLAVFTKFSDYDGWNGTIVFMGRIIGGDEIPWYYIPVWLLVSLPAWYLVLLVLAATVFVFAWIRKIKRHDKMQINVLFHNKYVFWAFLIGFLPWIATVAAHSTLYNAWRHCYFILPPMILIILSGLKRIGNDLGKNMVSVGLTFAMVFCLAIQVCWIIKNHPYEMVYLNAAARKWGADFDRDYWHLANLRLCRYILEKDDSETITLGAASDRFLLFLGDEEKERISMEENPMYYLETYRGKTGNGSEMEGYEDYYSITVDGYRIATIFKRQS